MSEIDVLQKIVTVAEHYMSVACIQSSDMGKATLLLSGMTTIVGLCVGAQAMAKPEAPGGEHGK